MSTRSDIILEVKDISMSFGGILALKNLDLSLRRGGLVGLIGPNGAGKTTAFNVITGVYPPTTGEIRLANRRLSQKRFMRARAGISRTFQNIRIFKNLSVLDNVKVALGSRATTGFWSVALRLKKALLEETRHDTEAVRLLELLRLSNVLNHRAGALPYGAQRRLEIARALATEPCVLLLDEPAAGMNTSETNELMRIIDELRSKFALSILLIEHDMKLVMGICEEIVVLDHGVTIARGKPAEIQHDPAVIEAYLGRSRHDHPERGDNIPRATAQNGAAQDLSGASGSTAPFTAKKPLLHIRDLQVHYGAIHALKGVSLDVEEGAIVTLIGANGAGKSTTLRAISGVLSSTSGAIELDGQSITQLRPHEIVGRGITQAPEGRGVFVDLSVEDNLLLGAFLERDKTTLTRERDRCFSLFPRLFERRKQLAGTLSGGEQQMLAISRALMGRPRVLLLDEPSLGLAPQIVDTIFEIIQTINGSGTTILLVEQNAARALEVSHKGYVLETGAVALSGPSHELLRSDAVRKSYLGE